MPESIRGVTGADELQQVVEMLQGQLRERDRVLDGLTARVQQWEGRVAGIDTRLEVGTERFSRLEAHVDELVSTQRAHAAHLSEVRQMQADIRALLELFGDLRGTLRTLSMLGNLIKWLGGVAVVIGAGIAWFKSGG
ncbi:hypothetical protein [Chitiniphilus eburneus]|uniref:DUF1640 domain-containing protein n=1 Tax=Chitiniphilus eburneus TaxID=2571148 RepID=A0A4U0Q194_9NEIS|nr:hypothetical protein [Chitiniphilus eburneus]TJZ73762.1 hypothetical protein FAZ21_09060 [Chitiniphilus eburneus]